VAFDTGYECGRADEAKRHQVRDEQITRLARAADAAANGDPSLLAELSREQGGDDLPKPPAWARYRRSTASSRPTS
jgi:hypothetical protein